MLRTSGLFPIVVSALLLSVSPTAQEMRRQGGPPPYNPKTEVTVTGTVIETETITPPDRPEMTVLLLTVDNAKLAVFIGPTDWVKKQKFEFTKGAAATVVGNKGFVFRGTEAVQPRTVKIGTRTLEVRDASGKPVWES